MRYTFIFLFLLLLWAACHRTKQQSASAVIHGETAFLLRYNGRLPGDVGFLTNHVVERRVANMLKDSFSVFMAKTAFAKPIVVCDSAVVRAVFFSDSLLQNPDAEVMIDVHRDAFWVSYQCGDSMISCSDHPSWAKPECR